MTALDRGSGFILCGASGSDAGVGDTNLYGGFLSSVASRPTHHVNGPFTRRALALAKRKPADLFTRLVDASNAALTAFALHRSLLC